ncbi:hyalin-like [Lytechinus pictus]|uniref:hyalin-like n=1 Tax=Lytechinus pictus TaxID=7653 RepID=UPI0030BA19C7
MASPSTCKDGYNLPYVLPMFEVCGVKEHPVMGLMPTIPKLIPSASQEKCNGERNSAIPLGKRICRFSDCLNDPCKNGRCEDTITAYVCHCPAEFTGPECATRLNDYNPDHSTPSPVDTTPPEVTGCPTNQTVTVPVGITNHTFTWTPPSATDESGILSVIADNDPGVNVSVGEPVTVTYTVTDNNGLTNTECSFNLTVIQEDDTVPPEVVGCPQDQTITLPVMQIAADSEPPTQSFNWEPPTATDDAGIQSIIADKNRPLTLSLDDTVTVTYTVTDNSGLINTGCSFTLSLQQEADTTPPVVNGCPPDQTITAATSSSTQSFTWNPPTATDDAGIQSIVPSSDRPQTLSVGDTITVTYNVTDNSGLINTGCSFTLTLQPPLGGGVGVGPVPDDVKPTVHDCPGDQTFTIPVNDASMTSNTFSWTPPTASDDSGIQSTQPSHQPGVAVAVADGPLTVTYTVTDNSGMVNSDCSFTLTTRREDLEWKCTATKCYYLDAADRSWQEADNFCTNLNLVHTSSGKKDPSLLFNDNKPVFEVIEGLFSLNREVWINCKGVGSGGALVCDVDGTGTSHTTTNWKSGEPADGVINCVAVDLIYEKWTSQGCQEQYHTMCQIIL